MTTSLNLLLLASIIFKFVFLSPYFSYFWLNYCQIFCKADNMGDVDVGVKIEYANGGGASDIEDWRINIALKIGSLDVELRTLRV